MVRPIRVIVCDDLWGTEIQKAAAADTTEPRIEVIGVVQTVDEAVAALRHMPDVIVIDNYLPAAQTADGSTRAIELVAKITAAVGRDQILCILWSSNMSDLDIYSFVAYGGHNYCNKNRGDRDEALLGMIRATVAGDRWTPTPEALDDEKAERLVKRELRLIAMLAKGDHYKDIADAFGTSQQTISNRVSALAQAFFLDRSLGGYNVKVPESARRAGYFYVPKDYWHYDPDGAPWPLERPRADRDETTAENAAQ